MRLLLTAIVLAAVATAPARAETLPGALAYGSLAFATNGAGTSAIAFESRRAVHVSISRPGRRFGRPVRIARGAPGEQYDNAMHVAVGKAGDVVVVWERFDATEPEDSDLRDEGCCLRIHAVRISPGGRRRPAQVLSRAGLNAYRAASTISSAGRVAVTWTSEYVGYPWRARTASRRGRFGRARTLTVGSGSPTSALTFAGRVLRALYVRGVSRVRERRLPGRSRRVTRRFVGEVGASAADGFGRLLLASQQTLLAVGRDGRLRRLRRFGRRPFYEVRLAATPAGHVAHALLPGYKRRGAEIRFGTTAGDLGPGRRLTSTLRMPWDSGRLAVSPGGEAALFMVRASASRRSLYVATPSRFGPASVPVRRIARLRAETEMAGAAYDGAGRPFAVLRVGKRIRVVRP